MNLKERLYLSAMRWPRVSRCASIVSRRDIKLINARTKLVAKSPTVTDIITVCYTMNVQHLSYRLVRTHKLSPQLTPGNALPYVATTNSLAANERVVYFQVGLVQIQGENMVATIEMLLFWMTAAQTP